MIVVARITLPCYLPVLPVAIWTKRRMIVSLSNSLLWKKIQRSVTIRIRRSRPDEKKNRFWSAAVFFSLLAPHRCLRHQSHLSKARNLPMKNAGHLRHCSRSPDPQNANGQDDHYFPSESHSDQISLQ